MQTARQNPFHKSNPFQCTPYQKFKHSHLPISSGPSTSIPFLEAGCHQPSSVSNSNWGFNKNNMGKRVDFSRKQDVRDSNFSDFSVRMKISSTYVVPNDRPKHAESRDVKLENPFLRKNLIGDREEVYNQVQIDLNMSRRRTTSNYEEGRKSINEKPIQIKSIYEGLRVSFGSVPSQSPYMARKQSKTSAYQNAPMRRSERFEKNSNPYEKQTYASYDPALIISTYQKQNNNIGYDQAESLVYSKTPVETKRNPEEDAPSTLVFQKKRFYLNPVLQQQ